MFDFGEGLFDRVWVGRIGREIPEPRAGGRERLSHGGGFVAAEIVHDDDVALFDGWRELLFDMGAEAFAVDRSVEDARRREPVVSQRAQECQRAPMAMRREAAQALAFRPLTAQRRHVCLDPGLVDEDEMARIETRLP